MNDRELLELAARAAGIDPVLAEPINFSTGVEYYWNPRDDDGDALRLAVSTGLHKRLHEILKGPAYNADALSYGEAYATRKAILRTAAEIGKSMGGGE
ncbi:hypothetical protein AN449_02610 [Pseudomonas aeruginosa]|uniref:hypothetical protein n=1 Tax=Pseudomonas aeruginosa TaxID=287 RepID=UPI0007176501|nr:hypothetical protein [Pseudomonas aeruginosa]KRU69644.1 hypothetical protein AN449_02610 [Pseudomonas aeruginosa]VEE75744.1 Uncharacterised protein [Pseudomonas aeruginosa]